MTLSEWMHSKPMRTQILLSVGIVATITIAVVYAVAVGMFDWIGKDSKDLVSSTLESQARDYLLQSSTGTADAIDKKFVIMEEIVSVMSTSLTYMFRTSIPYAPVPSYLWWDDSTLPPDHAFNSRWNYEVSHCCSSFYITGGTYENMSVSLQNPLLADAVERSAHLDLFFPQLVDQNTEIAQCQLGFSGIPLLRRYPAISAFRSRDYDHTQRPWYRDAIGSTIPLYSDPYQNSITFEWTISISQAVPNPNGGTVGVAAIEMRTNTLQRTILSQQLFTTGYALLLQSNGVVVAGRVWDNTKNTTLNINTLSNFLKISSLKPLGTPAVQRLTVNGQDMLVSQSQLIRNRFVVVHIAPRDEILAVVSKIVTKIDNNNNNLLGITAAVGVGTLVLVLIFSSLLTSRVVKPVGTISDVALKIVHNATKTNIMENVEYSNVEYQEDEIGDLARAFSTMIDKLSGKSAKHHSIPISSSKQVTSIEMSSMH